MIKAEAVKGEAVEVSIEIKGQSADVVCELCGIICHVISVERDQGGFAAGVSADEMIDVIADVTKDALNGRSETE